MRLLYSASFVIMLVDILTKQPIKEAIILCNGKQNPYVTKDEGYYVFCNLYPGDYEISIYASGYVSKTFSSSLEFGESKEFILEMSFESTNDRLLNVPRIEFSVFKNNLLVKESEVKITLKTYMKTIKLIQKIKSGEQEIILNIPEDNSFILQNYIYHLDNVQEISNSNGDEKEEKDDDELDNEDDEDLEDEDLDDEDLDDDPDEDNENEEDENYDDESEEDENDDEDAENLDEDIEDENEKSEKNSDDAENDNDDEMDSDENNDNEKIESKTIDQEMLFVGYDRKFNAYILDKEVKQNIPIGGVFLPYWNLKTDRKGKIILPFFSKIMKDVELEFEINFEDRIKTVKVNTDEFDLKLKILRVRVDL